MVRTYRNDRVRFGHIIRDILIEHMDGKKVDFRHAAPHSPRRRAIRVLLDRGHVSTEDRGSPDATTITEKGRRELANILADYADALLRAAYGSPIDPRPAVMVRPALVALSWEWIAEHGEAALPQPETPTSVLPLSS